MNDLLYQIIQDVQSAQYAFCRYITGNDTGKTGSHQAGFYIPKEAARLLFDTPVERGENKDRFVEIKWQNDFITHSRFIYYGSKTRNEYRITRFGRNFPFFEDENVGDLMILAQITPDNYAGYVLSSDEDIDDFLSYFNLSPNNTNQLIDTERSIKPNEQLGILLNTFVQQQQDFPDTRIMALTAYNTFNMAFKITPPQIVKNPDAVLLQWIDTEYSLFQRMEEKVYTPIISRPFSNIKIFIEIANQILNRRKSRAGKSLEHHLAKVFDCFNILYEEQVITEERKKPDFIFPNSKCYHNFKFPADLLISLAAKTTCKDRWRQILNEADRIDRKHLFTLQQAISKNQLEEMKKENVKLVVPHNYIKSFPKEHQNDIWDLLTFLRYTKEKQERLPKNFFIS